MTESLLDKVITGAFICKDEIEYRLDTLKSKLDPQDQMHALLESQQETMKALVAYLKEQHGFMSREEHERYMED